MARDGAPSALRLLIITIGSVCTIAAAGIAPHDLITVKVLAATAVTSKVSAVRGTLTKSPARKNAPLLTTIDVATSV
ncbi:MAG: hypothetical protein DDT19_02940 [Syntrophomonadaceae bacterium]|nr:hypothetical protein [Bacillota bacterium]